MDAVAAAVLESWRLDLRMIFALLAAAWIYVRDWRQLHRQMPSRYTTDRLIVFLVGLGTIFVALASPLDAFGNLLLEAHMVQHLLLIMIAPLLILTGQPGVLLFGGVSGGVGGKRVGRL